MQGPSSSFLNVSAWATGTEEENHETNLEDNHGEVKHHDWAGIVDNFKNETTESMKMQD